MKKAMLLSGAVAVVALTLVSCGSSPETTTTTTRQTTVTAAPPPAAAPAEPDYAAELTKLAQLRDQGVISAEDYEAKKKQILGI